MEFGFLYHPIQALFDSDILSSFIPPLLVESLHLDTSLVDDPLVVSNPIGLHDVFGLKVSILSVGFGCDACWASRAMG